MIIVKETSSNKRMNVLIIMIIMKQDPPKRDFPTIMKIISSRVIMVKEIEEIFKTKEVVLNLKVNKMIDKILINIDKINQIIFINATIKIMNSKLLYYF